MEDEGEEAGMRGPHKTLFFTDRNESSMLESQALLISVPHFTDQQIM